MQDRYAGDIGDYLKFFLVRKLAPGRRLGVAWYRHPDEGHNADGKHVGYLSQPNTWRDLDPDLFDRLGILLSDGRRSLRALEQAGIVVASFHGEPVPVAAPARRDNRVAWLSRLRVSVADCDLLFVDPDNGIDLHRDAERRCLPKSVHLAELLALRAPGRALVVYHHQTRRAGGHAAEIGLIAATLRAAGFTRIAAIRAKPFSPRVFFILDGDEALLASAHAAVAASGGWLEWFACEDDSAPTATQEQIAGAGFAATVLTLYPEMFPGPLGHALAGRALREGRWSLDAVNIRDFATDRHRSVDDTPAGGGAGMVMRADVLAAAVDAHTRAGVPVLATTPRGVPLTQRRVREIAGGAGVTILCGRFEGMDERLFEARGIAPVSIGDYVLSGGEVAALVLLDACVRLLPGVMGAASSGDVESFETGLLEYPHYTRPVIWEGRTIPEVLRSGDHARIAAWRQRQAETDTRLRRPDLWERHVGVRVQPPSGARRDEEER